MNQNLRVVAAQPCVATGRLTSRSLRQSLSVTLPNEGQTRLCWRWGLGGRLDSTNVCQPRVSIITSISFDHVNQLGNTLAAIAAEKAGIIKPGVPVISGVTAAEPREVVRRIAQQNGCRLLELGVDFDFDYHPPRHLEEAARPAAFDFIETNATLLRWRESAPRHESNGTKVPARHSFNLALLGRHQAANAALVLAAVGELRSAGWTIPDAAVRKGLAEVAWPARVEVVARRPVVILDAAHNAASVAALTAVLAESFSAQRRWLVVAVSQEKDIGGMLQSLLREFDHVIFTRYQENPRGVPPEELLAPGRRRGVTS